MLGSAITPDCRALGVATKHCRRFHTPWWDANKCHLVPQESGLTFVFVSLGGLCICARVLIVSD
jgi:hypothetical protein